MKQEIKKGKPFKVDSIDYKNGTVIKKSVLKKDTGSVTISSLTKGEKQGSKSSPFDTFIHVIDGTAEIIIDSKAHQVVNGQAIIIPAHSQNSINANENFKMISIIIKSGYVDVSN